MALASVQRRDAVQVKVRAALAGEAQLSEPAQKLLEDWVRVYEDAEACDALYKELEPLLKAEMGNSPLLQSIYHSRSMLTKNSQWCVVRRARRPPCARTPDATVRASET